MKKSADTGPQHLRIAMLGQKGFPAVWGGIEFHVDALARRLAGLNHEVTVFVRSYYQKEAARLGIAMPGKVRVRRMPTLKTKHLDALAHTGLSTLGCAFRGYDVLHYHGIGPGSLLALARWLVPGAAKVLTVHALDWQRAKWSPLAQKLLRQCEKIAVAKADKIIAVSTPIRDYLLETYKRDAAVIPNGVQPAQLRPPGPYLNKLGLTPKKFFLFVGRLVPEKGAHTLIQAFQALDADDDWRLVVAGPGQEVAYTADVQAMAGGDDRIILPGTVGGDDLYELFSNAGAFVLPSLLEGFPLALLEGLSYGLPVIASRLPSVQDALARLSSENIFLTAPGDAGDLKGRLQEVMDFYKNIKSKDDVIHQRDLSGFSWDTVTEKTAAVYRDALRKQ